MDVMMLRRGLLAQMAAKGKDFISGTFTAPDSGSAEIQFGRISNNYLFVIDATDSAASTIMNSGLSDQKGFHWFGAYPQPAIGSQTWGSNYTSCLRVVPSTGVLSISNTSVPGLYNDRISIRSRDITSSSYPNNVYAGLSYNYTVVFLD